MPTSPHRPPAAAPAAPAAPAGIPAAAGIGLRAVHFEALTRTLPPVAWLEIHPENYLGGGAPLAYLAKARAQYPVSMHGVGLSLGSVDGVDAAHLARLAALARRIEPGLISEHVAWSVHQGTYFNDLLPLPYTEESLAAVCRNIAAVQEAFGRPILVENASTYLQFAHSTIAEPDFLRELTIRTGCGLLLDVNNVYVSCRNHGWDADAYLDALAGAPVGEIHLAGHAENRVGDRVIRIDDHGSPVAAPVWALYRRALELFGPVPTLIEWDTAIPPLAELLAEADRAQALLTEVLRRADAA
ncbi:MAG: DUF692 domain-containing protein [Alphaproteobacteria bacterium]|nr:DUF692 domain-containing protein [Alphaproteobacteria bacterium]MCB9930132.1 DUF692 domain-containing protein [Alphaproteobacteria bacterium]